MVLQTNGKAEKQVAWSENWLLVNTVCSKSFFFFFNLFFGTETCKISAISGCVALGKPFNFFFYLRLLVYKMRTPFHVQNSVKYHLAMWLKTLLLCYLHEPHNCVFFFFPLFRAINTGYGSSQAKGRIRAVAAALPHSHNNVGWIRATSATCNTAHSNTSSLIHLARPGIKPTSSWILVGFITAGPQQKFPSLSF